MNCDEVRAELPSYLEGDTPEPLRGAIERHLSACARCRREHDSLARVAALAGFAPLEASPPQDLESRVMEIIELDPVAGLVEGVPLEHEPPLELERAALERAGALARQPRRWQRLAARLTPGLAAALVVLGFLGYTWLREARTLEEQFGPPGETMQFVRLGGPSPLPPGGAGRIALVHYSHDNYGAVLQIQNLPLSRPNYHYEVWMLGPEGRVSVGTFRVPGKSVYNFPLGVDPADFWVIQISHEPIDGNPDRTGEIMWQAPLRT